MTASEPAPAETRLAGPPLRHPGMCDAPAAVGIAAAEAFGAFLVANDEDNRLRVYANNIDASPPRPTASQPRLVGGDLNGHLGITSGREADLEGAARLGVRAYWIGSHGRNSNGRRRAERQRFLATDVRRSSDGTVTISPVGSSRDLLPALRGAGLAAAIGDTERREELAPEEDGLNIEGLAAGRDERSLFIALRNPLKDGKALVVPLESPADVVEAGAEPRLNATVPLDLSGRGVRSIEHVPARDGYLVPAGPNRDGGAGFDLYSWSGRPGDEPAQVPGAAALLNGLDRFHPEAMVVHPDGRSVLILRDDGDLPLRGDNRPCKDLDAAAQEFRSVLLVLD